MVITINSHHGRVWKGRIAEALGRIDEYNRLVDSIQKSVGIYTRNFETLKKLLRKIFRNYGSGDCLIIFLDINQSDEYWVGVDQNGNFYDGWDCTVGEKTYRRISLSHIDIMDKVAWSNSIYSKEDDGKGCKLDYCTLLGIKSCLKMSLYPIIGHQIN